MAERCPLSLFMGKGRIDGYRWQINERGVANIVDSGRDFVEGLVYQVNAQDKRLLDRSEGVARGFYNDEHLDTQFLPLPNRGIKTFHVAKGLEMDDQPDPEQRELLLSVPRFRRGSAREYAFVDHEPSYQPPSSYPKQGSFKTVEALVYISREYKDDGSIRPEYVARMEKAITDGRKMGLSDQYLNHIARTIHQEVPPRENNDAFPTSYDPYERMEIDSTSHEPYKTLESTRPRLEQHERVPTSRPNYATFMNVITARPRYQDFSNLDGDIVYKEKKCAVEIPYRPSCDTGRQSETRERRRERAPTRSRQSRRRDERSGAGSSRLLSWRSPVERLLEPVFERRKRSSSTPY